MHNFFTKLQKLLLTALLCLLTAAPALAASVSSAPLTGGSARNGMVRVKLQSLGNPASLTLTVNGSYTVNGQASRALASGTKVTVKKANGGLSLTVNGATTAMGASFRLRRHATDGQNGVRIAQARVPGNLYPGDFTFTLSGSSLTVIASVYMEDYLYGVLPYEMGDQSGLEALKAQAVAARTYTLRAMNSSAGRAWDVVDTTADQVYNGTPSGCANCKKAVNATKGIVVKNGSAFTATYYTASNGGQTESLKNAWGIGNNAALTVKDDPFDLKNGASAKKTFTVNASGAQKNAVLNSLLQRKAAAVFGSSAWVSGVSDVFAHTPRYDSPSKLYTKLTFSVAYEKNGGTHTGELTFDIFSELEGPLSMSINSMKNELWSVERTASGFTVSARRYGHGIGMSQRGAMQMAREGYTYDQILGFYYTGCTRVQYALSRSILSAVSANQKSQEQIIAEQPADITDPAPAASAQPTPASAPAAASAALTARVATPQGSLNLRKTAKDTAKVLCTVPQGESVTVLEKGKKWCSVSYRGITGFVMTRFLSFGSESVKAAASPAPDAAPAASAAPAVSSGAYAKVTTKQGSLKLRKAAQSNGKILRTIPQNETVKVVKKNVTWTKVTYGGVSGYVMTKFLTFTDTPAPKAAPLSGATDKAAQAGKTGKAGTARVVTKSGSLYLRKTKNGSSKVLASIPQGADIPILSKGGKWCKTVYDGKTGYVMTKYLSFPGTSAKQSAPAPAASASASAGKEKLRTLKTAVLGKITTGNGNRLNLRAACENDAAVLRQMPDGEYLTITAVGDTWCAVVWQDQKGFCKKEFLEFTLYE